jgi:hypothetical protein
MKKSLAKKARKVIEENLAQFMQAPSLMELTKIGARMMLQAALEEEVRVFLDRDYLMPKVGGADQNQGV